MQADVMIDALALAGAYMEQHASCIRRDSDDLKALNTTFYDEMEQLIKSEVIHNPWFTEHFVRQALGEHAKALQKEDLLYWLSNYPELPIKPSLCKKVGVVMAGNIPLVGLHDMLSVLLSGHEFHGKTSSKDDRLIRLFARILTEIEPGFNTRIHFYENQLKNMEAIIATGSDNTSRYFEYYFRNIPHIIRKNRNGVAVLKGDESDEDLEKLGGDISSYFGLGCRNVTKIYLPESMDLTRILRIFETMQALTDHHKYANNIDYNRSVFLMNKIPFLDNGGILFKKDSSIASPVGVVYYEKYSQIENVIEVLKSNKESIQCVISKQPGIEGALQPGESQKPRLWDYADGIDTMDFLEKLNK